MRKVSLMSVAQDIGEYLAVHPSHPWIAMTLMDNARFNHTMLTIPHVIAKAKIP
jgi:hypothetical protein